MLRLTDKEIASEVLKKKKKDTDSSPGENAGISNKLMKEHICRMEQKSFYRKHKVVLMHIRYKKLCY